MEAWDLGERRRRLEIGLHLESANHDLNTRLLEGMLARLNEIKAEPGASFEVEPWDKSWTKVYETIPLEPFNDDCLEWVAARLARVIDVLEPMRHYRMMGGKQ